MNQKLSNFEKKLDSNIKTTKHNSKYTRRDSAVFAGIPPVIGPDGTEDCKKIIVDVCKELHLVINENLISTAHRLNQHPSKQCPRPIIVNFISRGASNEVYVLKEVAGATDKVSCGAAITSSGFTLMND